MRLLLAISLTASVQGQALPGVEPRLPEASPVESLPPVRAEGGLSDEGEILAQRVNRIILQSTHDDQEVVIGPGVAASESLMVPSPRTLASRLEAWLDRPLTTGGLGALADKVLYHYDSEGFPVVSVDVPEQDLSTGDLKLVLEVGRYGEIGVSRPKYGKPELVQQGMFLQRGDLVNRQEIDRQMEWYGRTGFRRPRLFVSPGLEPATADMLIAFEERRPWRVTLGYENSGPELLGRDRMLLGIAGVTPSEHLIAWQTVAGMPVSSLLANALRWEIPFHGIHQVLQIDAAYAEVASRYQVRGFPIESQGSSWSLGAMQKIPLPDLAGWSQSVGAGIEVKGTDQFLLFGGGSLSPGQVILFHGKMSHKVERSWEMGGASFESTFVASPGGVGGDNSDAAFKAYDPEADASYVIARVSGQGWWSPGADWQLRLRGAAQVADSRLLPAEQFAAGGYQSVRGAGEREYFADGGWQTSLELHSPLISPTEGWAFRALTFFDYATLDDRGGDSSSLSGAGLGLRMKVTEMFDLRLDHGWRLDESENRSHFGINFTF